MNNINNTNHFLSHTSLWCWCTAGITFIL
uniref:Uncharacterized protein n=1 Tax=Anguilla anguilla TaxID=7936 RepID=A0A0E9XKW2_ANGAN